MKKIPQIRQKAAFAVLFIMGANLLFGCSYRAKQDSWISMFFATVALFIWVFVIARLSVLYPGKDIFQLLKILPRWFSFPMILFVTFYCFGQAAMTIRAYAGFVHIVSLPNTSILIFLALTVGIVFLFLCREDSILFRFAYMESLPIVFIILLLFLLLLNMFRVENLFPVFYNNTKDVMLCSMENFSHPFGNIFLLLGLTFFPEDKKKNTKTWLVIVACAGFLSLIIVFQNILLLGGELTNSLDFPYNFSASLVNLADFFSRIEVFASLFFFLSGIIRSSYFMKLVSRGLVSLAPVSSKAMALPLSVLLFGYSAIAFNNTNSILNYLKIFPFIAMPLQFALPLIVWLTAEIKSKRKNEDFSSGRTTKIQILL